MKNTRYIIKVTAIATSDNPNFAGEVHTCYYGKGQSLIKDHAELLDELWFKYRVEEYGYKRKYDAVKASKFWDNTYDAKYWDYDTEIVEYTL